MSKPDLGPFSTSDAPSATLRASEAAREAQMASNPLNLNSPSGSTDHETLRIIDALITAAAERSIQAAEGAIRYPVAAFLCLQGCFASSCILQPCQTAQPKHDELAHPESVSHQVTCNLNIYACTCSSFWDRRRQFLLTSPCRLMRQGDPLWLQDMTCSLQAAVLWGQQQIAPLLPIEIGCRSPRGSITMCTVRNKQLLCFWSAGVACRHGLHSPCSGSSFVPVNNIPPCCL